MVSAWTGDLDRPTETKLREHLETCESCRLEMAELSGFWERLGDIPVPEPSQSLHNRWQSSLAGVRAVGSPSGNTPPRQRPRNTGWKFSLAAIASNRPVWQATAAAAILLLGVFIGTRVQSGPSPEVAQLRQEVTSTRQLVTLSLMREQGAAERLRGVDYTTRMPVPAMDTQVVNALVQAATTDESVNVRLAAIDALTRLSGNASVRQSMVNALGKQESPLVQAALIDYLVDAKDKQALPAIRELSSQAGVDPAIRRRAQTAVGQLVQYK
jgi:hypothetical protein